MNRLGKKPATGPQHAKYEKFSENPEITENEDLSVFFDILGMSVRQPVSRSPPTELHLLGWSGPKFPRRLIFSEVMANVVT